ncbi:MAG TPA: hypothetical protein VEQ10_04575, partial [Vicinamibacteria bacterium]|nr:hypothetical protein [Vicinamibacteria bacterium]
MCGIVGYVGGGDAVAVLLDGLRRLEYRGYDSAGLAVVSHGVVERRRSAGKLDNLASILGREPLQGEWGVGHTRWATHGRPTERLVATRMGPSLVIGVAESARYVAPDVAALLPYTREVVSLGGAPKLKEISYLHAEGYPAGEMKHG